MWNGCVSGPGVVVRRMDNKRGGVRYSGAHLYSQLVRRLRQDEVKFEPILGNLARPCLKTERAGVAY